MSAIWDSKTRQQLTQCGRPFLIRNDNTDYLSIRPSSASHLHWLDSRSYDETGGMDYLESGHVQSNSFWDSSRGKVKTTLDGFVRTI